MNDHDARLYARIAELEDEGQQHTDWCLGSRHEKRQVYDRIAELERREEVLNLALNDCEEREAKLREVAKAVGGVQDRCCGAASKPEYACMHDRARQALTPTPPKEKK